MTQGMSELQKKFRCAKRSTPAFLHQHGNSAAAPAPIRTRRRLLRTHLQTTVPGRPIPASFHSNQWLRRGRQKPWLPLRQQKEETTRRQRESRHSRPAAEPKSRSQCPDGNDHPSVVVFRLARSMEASLWKEIPAGYAQSPSQPRPNASHTGPNTSPLTSFMPNIGAGAGRVLNVERLVRRACVRPFARGW